MFSVVIPLYNKELSICNTVQSVLNQKFKNYEIIIINDGSTDNSVKVVNEFKDPRIRIISKKNGGVSSARNRGIEEANENWIVFLDGDDVWLENHLENLNMLIAKYSGFSVFCSSYIKSNEDQYELGNRGYKIVDDYFVEALYYNFFWTSIACIKKDVFNEVGFFDERFSRGEDLELWEKIGRKYKIVRSLEITAIYKIDSENKLTNLTFDFNRSTLYNIHKRFDFYVSKTEKTFYITKLKKYLKVFIRRLDLVSFARTYYRFVILCVKRIK